MKSIQRAVAAGFAAIAAVLPLAAHATAAERQYFPADTSGPLGLNPPFSSAVRAGQTLYVAGRTDGAPVAGDTAAAAAKRALDSLDRAVKAGGMTMDDLVWVQIFSSNLADFADFNAVYRSYFKGPMPARAFLGVDHLLGGARFEVMGVAVKK